MKRLLSTLFLFCAFGAFAAVQEQRLYYVITNAPSTNGQTVSVNGVTRIFTNTASGSTFIQTNASIGGTATNLYNHFSTYPIVGGALLSRTNTNCVVLYIPAGTLVSFGISSNLGYVTSVTNSTTNGITPRFPIEVQVPNVATNLASLIVSALSGYSTQAFATNSAALSNYLSLGPQTQTFSNKIALNTTNRNGTITNAVVTNSVFGAGTLAGRVANSGTIVGGTITNATVTNSTVGGATLSGRINGAAAVIVDASVSNLVAVANVYLGQTTITNGLYILTGDGAIRPFLNIANQWSLYGDTGAGYLVLTDDNLSQDIVQFAGADGTVFTLPVTVENNATVNSNLTVLGSSTFLHTLASGSNRISGSLYLSRTNITTLANGVNLVDPGLYSTYIKVSGPSAAYSIDKINRGWDGRRITIQKTDSFTLTLANESGSGGGAAADRVLTGTGANVTITNNPGFVTLIYDPDTSRWGIESKSN